MCVCRCIYTDLSQYKLMCSSDDFNVQTKKAIGLQHSSLLLQLEHRAHSFSAALTGCT